VRSADDDTASDRGKALGIEHDIRLRRNLREMTVSGGEAGLRKE